MKRFFIIFLACILVSKTLFAAADVYKSTDAQGNTSFSDSPSPNSEKIQVQPVQSIPSPPPVSVSESSDPTNGENENADITNYTIEITQPKNGDVLSTDLTSIDVSCSIDPSLNKKDRIQFLLNGEPYGSLSTSTSISMTSPEGRMSRGEYSVQALVVSAEDPTKVKGQSDVVTVYQRRHSILLPK